MQAHDVADSLRPMGAAQQAAEQVQGMHGVGAHGAIAALNSAVCSSASGHGLCRGGLQGMHHRGSEVTLWHNLQRQHSHAMHAWCGRAWCTHAGCAIAHHISSNVQGMG